jgi:hypothetical protein
MNYLIKRASMLMMGSVLALACVDGTMAYDSVAVTNGGTLQGKVSLKGSPPPPKEFELRRYPDGTFCGLISDGKGNRLLHEVIAGQDGGLKDVVVVVEGVQKGKPFNFPGAQVEANICQFLPFVTVMGDKREITVTNRDKIFHDIQGYAFDRQGIDIVLHRASLEKMGTTDTVNLTKGRKAFVMQCGQHPYMQNWGYAIDNPYYFVTSLDGAFTIGDLPPGTYKVTAWHPAIDPQTKEVTVTANGAVSLDFTFEYKPLGAFGKAE